MTDDGLVYPRLELMNPDDAKRLPEGYLTRALTYQKTFDAPDLSVGETIRMRFYKSETDAPIENVCFSIDRSGRPVYCGNEKGLRPKLVCTDTHEELDLNTGVFTRYELQ
jgi:hypothetical protein